MTEDQIRLVKNSWKTFHHLDTALIGDLFYSRLFIENPRLRKMFPSSMNGQHRKLMDMLGFIVSRLDRQDTISEKIKALGMRHTRYGVKPEHYQLVGEALIWTLESGLGKEWNDTVKEAWLACYTMISQAMISEA